VNGFHNAKDAINRTPPLEVSGILPSKLYFRIAKYRPAESRRLTGRGQAYQHDEAKSP
jgi:hypothetical protein